MSGAMGLSLGPLLASVIYRYLDYTNTLLVFAAMILIIGLISINLIPKNIDEPI